MKRFLPHVVAFLVVAIWGTTFVFTKLLLLGGLTAAQIFILRFIIAYILLLSYCLARGIRWLADSWRDELLMVALGVTGGSLYFLTENSSMNYTTTTNTSIIVSLCPLFASAFIGFFYKSERLSRLQTFGTLMAAAGVIVVVMNGHFVLRLSPLGDTLAFAACLCWAFYSLLMIPANKRYDTVFVTRKVFFYGLLSMIPYLIVHPEMNIHLLFSKPHLAWNLLFLGCVASMLCFLAWNWALSRHELCLPKPRHHHRLRLAPPCRRDHPVVHSRHRAHPSRYVPCGSTFSYTCSSLPAYWSTSPT